MALVKHPALRIKNIAFCDPNFLTSLTADLYYIVELWGVSEYVLDFEVLGSYARGIAELHSDLDINIATTNIFEAKEAAANSPTASEAILALKSLWIKYGLRIDLQMQHQSVKDIPTKMCFSLNSGVTYGTETRRIGPDGQPIVDTPIRQPKLTMSVMDEELGCDRPFVPIQDDPWASELDEWRIRYGELWLEYGDTPETEHMKVT